MTATPVRPPAWAVLEQALRAHRSVRIPRRRPHCLPPCAGWKNGRAKLLAYQTDSDRAGHADSNPRQRWRSLFVDEIQAATVAIAPWQSSDNYKATSNGIDTIEVAVYT